MGLTLLRSLTDKLLTFQTFGVQMDFIDQYRPYVEFLYLLSGPLMLIGVIVAIIQLYFHRRESKIRFERETINSSINILDFKFKAIHNANDELEKLDSYNEVPFFEGEVKGLNKASVTCTNDFFTKYYDDDNHDHKTGVINVLNELETLSQYILSGVLDEELCYKLEGSHFLHYVEDYKHFIACERVIEEDECYAHLVKLYKLWSDKATHDNATKAHQKALHDVKQSKRPEPLKIIGK